MTIIRKSLDESKLDTAELKRIATIKDKDIDFSDIPELDASFFENAELKFPKGKKQLTIRLDEDMVKWFKSQGKGYQSRINAVLRSYYEAHSHN